MSKIKIMTDNVESFQKCSEIIKVFKESFKSSIKYIEDNGLYIRIHVDVNNLSDQLCLPENYKHSTSIKIESESKMSVSLNGHLLIEEKDYHIVIEATAYKNLEIC